MPIRQAARSLDGQPIAEYVDSLPGEAPVTVLAPSPGVLADLTAGTYADPPVSGSSTPAVRVVARTETLFALYETFQTGHQACELADREVVGYRALESVPLAGPVVVAPDHVASVVVFEDSYALVGTDRTDLAAVGVDRARTLWDRAEALDHPALPTWREVTLSLTEATGRETARTFDRLLAARRRATQARTLDVPTVAVLAGAATGARQRDLADWADRQSLAAASTLSTRKQTLEARGLVTTTPVSDASVGAPVHRLDVADEYVRGLTAEEFYEVAEELLAG